MLKDYICKVSTHNGLERSEIMRNGSFTRGLVLGSVIGASMSMMMNTDMMNTRKKKRMMKSGRNLLRKSGNIIVDVVDLLK